MSRGFTSMFADDLDNLISLKVSLGYSEGTYLGRARQFDRYCSMKYEKAGELTEGIVLNWLKPEPGEPRSVIHGRAAFIRGFGTYLKSVGKNAYILPDKFTAGGTVLFRICLGTMNWRRFSGRSIHTNIQKSHSVRSCSALTSA